MTASTTLPTDAELAVLDDPVVQRQFTRFTADADGQPVADSSLRITGMYCAACAGVIEQALMRVDGVVEATVSAAGERARVRWRPQRTRVTELVAAIRGAGYDASPDAAAEAREARRAEHRKALWRLFVAAFCAMQVMMLATPSYVSTGDELAPDMRQLLNWGSWVLSLPVMVFSAGPILQGAWQALRRRSIGMDVPVSLGILVTFVSSSGATFDPTGPFGHEVYFDSLTMFISFLLAGRLLELRARHRVAQTLEAAMQGMPQTALRLNHEGRTESVSVQRLQPGDLVQVPLGQAFPADGRLTQGRTEADESLLTGESRPVPKPPGAAVVAGSLNRGAPVVMQVERVGADTRLQAIVALMRDAMSQRPSIARAADRWAAPFLWTVLLLAAGAAAVWSVIDPPRAVWVAVSVLIVTCPCALSLAAPSAVLAATGALARRGLLLQRLDALETLTRVQRVYLDKTGTVTEGQPRLGAVHRLPGAGSVDQMQLLAWAASLAQRSGHPLSQALLASCERCEDKGWLEIAELPGLGMQARDGDHRLWRLGSRALVAPDDGDDTLPSAPLYFGRDGQAWLAFEFEESLRPDAKQAVEAWQARGLEVVLLSGDRPDRAELMARQLGVSRVLGGATPESKLAEIAQAQAQGLVVMMVGDGINDAPVLARADVSFAMGQGALVARAQADGVVVSNRLHDLALAGTVAARTMRVVRQNIAWAVTYNLACIPLALVGWLPPWAAGLGMACSSLLVVGNALRLSR
ncbi:MAG: cadmium-translocating P-type ATPase [Burkholderiales bacterium]|nr:cadmium-translocating P-type ATPase [Burkholderiales bacterium]